MIIKGVSRMYIYLASGSVLSLKCTGLKCTGYEFDLNSGGFIDISTHFMIDNQGKTKSKQGTNMTLIAKSAG